MGGYVGVVSIIVRLVEMNKRLVTYIISVRIIHTVSFESEK